MLFADEPESLHQAVELVEAIEVDDESACSLLLARLDGHLRSQVCAELTLQVLHMSVQRGGRVGWAHRCPIGQLADAPFQLAHRPRLADGGLGKAATLY